MTGDFWTVRLSAAAEADYRQILRWTAEHFGSRQAHTYADTLSSALQALSAGPAIVGARARPEIGRGIRTLHIARSWSEGRHLLPNEHA
ncbi:type II toxin-antitoxin system RelE/ParE family toxin [Rhodocyclus tenuis]|uniref:type II toxin-antitoxin system RelE/ParE family toxin n=1 Tax=Rhodocyclus tenuis TaxID=1066 RepID=UPI00190328D3|nr:hypothetical protein [Rhodocyclus tenuis]